MICLHCVQFGERRSSNSGV